MGGGGVLYDKGEGSSPNVTPGRGPVVFLTYAITKDLEHPQPYAPGTPNLPLKFFQAPSVQA